MLVDILAFSIELAALVAYGYWGAYSQDSLLGKVVLGLGIPVLVVVIWGYFFAPKAKRRLEMPWLLIGKIAIFSGSVIGLYFSQQPNASVWLGIAIILYLLLAIKSKQL